MCYPVSNIVLLFLSVNTRQAVCLLTHLVQQAVSVGEVQGLQAVGLTQEVVEMLNAKWNIRRRARQDKVTTKTPGFPLTGFVSRLERWWPQWETLSNADLCTSTCFSIISYFWHDSQLESHCHQKTAGYFTSLVNLKQVVSSPYGKLR